MNTIDQSQIASASRIDYRDERVSDFQKRNSFYRRSLTGGVLAGLLTTLFLAFGGFYITGDNAGIGFAKYVVLAAVLGVLLYQLKSASPSGQTFKQGIVVGMATSTVAAIITAIGTLIINGLDQVDAATIYPYFKEASSETLSAFILAGVTFFEGIVAGLILTFIWLQIFKDRKRAK